MAPRFLKHALVPVTEALDGAGETVSTALAGAEVSIDDLRADLRKHVNRVMPSLAMIAAALFVIATVMLTELISRDD